MKKDQKTWLVVALVVVAILVSFYAGARTNLLEGKLIKAPRVVTPITGTQSVQPVETSYNDCKAIAAVTQGNPVSSSASGQELYCRSYFPEMFR